MLDSFIIKRPWITEKAAAMNVAGKYVFMVKSGASKPEVKKAIKVLYKVDAVAVNMVNRPAKRKKFGSRGGKQESYRKAIVTLKKGQTIDLN